MPNTQQTDTHDPLTTGTPGPSPSNTGETSVPPAEDAGAQPKPKSELTYGALKGYFYTPKRGDIRGAFCLLIDGNTGEILENVFWTTYATSDARLDVSTGWREFNKSIPDMGPYEKSVGDKLSALLTETFSLSSRLELMQHPEDPSKLPMITEAIRKNFERATYYFLEFDTVLERLPRENLVAAGVLTAEGSEAAKTAADAAGQEEKSFEGTLINCMPIIDPAKGCPVSELKPGDLVEVKIQGGIGASGLIEQYLSSTNQDAVFPVESVEKKAKDKTYVFLTINEEIRGVITVTKDLRLRTIHMQNKKPFPFPPFPINTDNLVFFGTLFVAVLIIIVVIRMLFF
ncbi:MAG: hypothetical protein LBR61_02780 [Synergistaceae bacterium]|jgi:hypothetical protein|nr:hypothetical protein [Synergistaceae bacterium]